MSAPESVKDAPSLPDQMDLLDAARLETAMLKLQSLEAQKAPLIQRVKDAEAKYRIGPMDRINFETGAITRAQPAK